MGNDTEETTLTFEEAKARLLEQIEWNRAPEQIADWVRRFGPHLEWDKDREVFVWKDPDPDHFKEGYRESHPWNLDNDIG